MMPQQSYEGFVFLFRSCGPAFSRPGVRLLFKEYDVGERRAHEWFPHVPMIFRISLAFWMVYFKSSLV
jgi:hypothetical protein